MQVGGIYRSLTVSFHYILFVASEPSGAEYSAADVASLLKRIGMDHHVESFLREEITGKDLLTASDELLTELGVTSALERRKLRREFEKLL